MGALSSEAPRGIAITSLTSRASRHLYRQPCYRVDDHTGGLLAEFSAMQSAYLIDNISVRQRDGGGSAAIVRSGIDF
jgi:hypothetical protein